jgi:two-component system response regulator
MNGVTRPAEILLVEDNPDDADLVVDALQSRGSKPRVRVVEDGVAALAYLRREKPYDSAQRPDLILLDLNLPKKSGHEVLAEMKADEALKCIPVVVLTTSEASLDILRSYDLGASCYVTKPADLDRFFAIIDAVDALWLRTASLLPR